MRERRRHERKLRVGIFAAAACCAVVFIILAITLIVVKASIKKQHEVAVDDYNQNNWQVISYVTGGKKIDGCIDGVPYSYTDDGKYFKGIIVDGVDIGGMTYQEARTALVAVVDEKISQISMTVFVENACLVLAPSDFAISTNVNDILTEAYSLGRESTNDYAANYTKQLEMLKNNVIYTIEYSCDATVIGTKVSAIAAFVNTEPTEPYVTISQRPSANAAEGEGDSATDDEPIIRSDGAVVETVYADNGVAIADVIFNPGTNGFVLDEDAMATEILNAFNSGDYGATLSAALSETEPSITIDDLRANVQRLSSYESYFNDSSRNRRRNIQKAAAILNGCVVGAGQEISFNEYVGPRTEAGGWLPAAGITGGNSYEDSPGGGICQVSGTLYNALLAAGPNRIEITKRTHHTWPSTYVPFGLDATVDTNGPDLCWKNVSESDIYIFTYADTTEGQRTMYVYVYGAPQDDGSYYETYAETIEEIPAGETVIVENPLWPTGYQKELVKARTGYRAVAYLRHYDANGVLIETVELYRDYYVPVTGKIEVGTGDPSLPKPTN